ncbi:MAG TPA: AAA family ATPase, partial [Saprospiraceae bacterium]|nr:AAA family ATPase [Saprospiraceae bacterium]
MIRSLNIKNFAIIDEVSLAFEGGLTIITGETGAGKSILLGALNLILGGRVDSKMFFNQDDKCVIEAEFDISDYDLYGFFEEEDLDFDQHVIIRREILPSGKSRAFINDTPVNLKALQHLSSQLID